MLSGGVSVAHFADGTTRGALSSMAINLADATSTLPFLDDSSFIRVDATRADSVAIDYMPIIGRPAARQNVIFGYAWSGHGFAISLGFTEPFREWIESGQKPSALDVFPICGSARESGRKQTVGRHVTITQHFQDLYAMVTQLGYSLRPKSESRVRRVLLQVRDSAADAWNH